MFTDQKKTVADEINIQGALVGVPAGIGQLKSIIDNSFVVQQFATLTIW